MSLDGGSLSIVNDAQVGALGTGTLKIANGGSVTAAVVVIAGSSGSVGMVSVDGASLTIRGAGACVVGRDSGPGGTGLLTVANGGTVSASSAHLYKSGTLTGNGAVTTTNGTTTIEGTLAPNWTLTINGDLTFVSVAGVTPTMQCNVTPANLNSVDAEVTGTATLTGRVSVTMTGTFTSGTTFTLLNADVGVFGRFSIESINFPPGQNFTPKIQYDTHHVKLYLQPNT